MKDKNFQNNINSKSIDELTKELNQIIENLEKEKNLDNSIEDYQKLIKLNNIIEKKFQAESKNISTETKSKINKIIKKHD
jgi:exonuclease VII small subunit